MYFNASQLVDGVFAGFREAAETNVKLQKEFLLGWTRLLPGFTGRETKLSETFAQLQQEWCNAMVDLAKTQRKLVDTQMEAAFSSLDAVLGQGWNGGDGVNVEAAPPVKSAPPAPASVPRFAPVMAPTAPAPSKPVSVSPNIQHKVAVVTGGGSGIGAAVAQELANRGAKAVLLVDRSEAVNDVVTAINKSVDREVAVAKIGDTTDESFRKRVFNEAQDAYGLVSICVPAAGITRDSLSVRVDRETGKVEIYPIETFRQVTEVNLLAPIYWGIEMVARIAEDRHQRGLKRWDPEENTQGVVVFLGSVSSQGNKGQISYAVAKAGLEGAAATLQKEAIFYGVRCGVIHPGFTDTPMVRALGEEYLQKNVLPYTQLRRLIRPDEIADAICFMIANSAVSGELWADAGWHPPA